MTDPETSRDIGERPSRIVCIAYHQLSVMWGGHDLTASTGDASASGNAGGGMACTHRLLDLPLFATVCAALGNAYAVAKGSHESIATILGHAESGWRAGLEFASPVTGRIAGALETPLKAVDDAVCVGLDYVEEKVPAVKLPPGQLYANARDSIRNIFVSALETVRLLFGGSTNQIENSSSASEIAPRKESEKVSS